MAIAIESRNGSVFMVFLRTPTIVRSANSAITPGTVSLKQTNRQPDGPRTRSSLAVGSFLGGGARNDQVVGIPDWHRDRPRSRSHSGTCHRHVTGEVVQHTFVNLVVRVGRSTRRSPRQLQIAAGNSFDGQGHAGKATTVGNLPYRRRKGDQQSQTSVVVRGAPVAVGDEEIDRPGLREREPGTLCGGESRGRTRVDEFL